MYVDCRLVVLESSEEFALGVDEEEELVVRDNILFIDFHDGFIARLESHI